MARRNHERTRGAKPEGEPDSGSDCWRGTSQSLFWRTATQASSNMKRSHDANLNKQPCVRVSPLWQKKAHKHAAATQRRENRPEESMGDGERQASSPSSLQDARVRTFNTSRESIGGKTQQKQAKQQGRVACLKRNDGAAAWKGEAGWIGLWPLDNLC